MISGSVRTTQATHMPTVDFVEVQGLGAGHSSCRDSKLFPWGKKNVFSNFLEYMFSLFSTKFNLFSEKQSARLASIRLASIKLGHQQLGLTKGKITHTTIIQVHWWTNNSTGGKKENIQTWGLTKIPLRGPWLSRVTVKRKKAFRQFWLWRNQYFQNLDLKSKSQ